MGSHGGRTGSHGGRVGSHGGRVGSRGAGRGHAGAGRGHTGKDRVTRDRVGSHGGQGGVTRGQNTGRWGQDGVAWDTDCRQSRDSIWVMGLIESTAMLVVLQHGRDSHLHSVRQRPLRYVVLLAPLRYANAITSYTR